MIKAIFFDLYGTLAGFNPTRFQIQSKACAEYGLEVTPEGVLRGYALADAFMAEQNAVRPLRELERGERNTFFAEYERRVLRGDGLEVSPERARDIWRRIRAMPYELEPFDDVGPALTNLRGKGLTLGLISNMNRPGVELLEELGLAPYLDFAVTSHEVGATKPHPPIFHEALRRACAEPADAVHVGDQLTSDVEGARSVGIAPVLLDRDCNHVGIEGCPRIAGLAELPDVVATLG